VDSYLGFRFCSTGLHVCFCTSTMLFLLLWFCSIFEIGYCDTSRLAIFAQYCLGYLWSFVLPDELYGLFFNLCVSVTGISMAIELNVRFLLVVYVYYIDSTNPWAWEIFPSSLVFFSFLQFLLMIFSFPCRGHSNPSLSLFLGNWYFWGCKMELFSCVLYQSVHCWCIGRILIFVNWFCTLLFCWRSLWCLGAF
jgi:hypothetical protein